MSAEGSRPSGTGSGIGAETSAQLADDRDELVDVGGPGTPVGERGTEDGPRPELRSADEEAAVGEEGSTIWR